MVANLPVSYNILLMVGIEVELLFWFLQLYMLNRREKERADLSHRHNDVISDVNVKNCWTKIWFYHNRSLVPLVMFAWGAFMVLFPSCFVVFPKLSSIINSGNSSYACLLIIKSFTKPHFFHVLVLLMTWFAFSSFEWLRYHHSCFNLLFFYVAVFRRLELERLSGQVGNHHLIKIIFIPLNPAGLKGLKELKGLFDTGQQFMFKNHGTTTLHNSCVWHETFVALYLCVCVHETGTGRRDVRVLIVQNLHKPRATVPVGLKHCVNIFFYKSSV